jgi:ribosomal protein S18 acetylase RimI-like enzyme
MQKCSKLPDGFSDAFADLVRYQTLTRECAVRNAEAIVGLGADNAWENWTVENLLDERSEKWALSLVAFAGPAPVGYAVASRRGDSIHLHHLMVDARRRSTGIGGELLRRLAMRARGAGVEEITLKVYRQNERATAFYRRYGFAVVEGGKPDLVPMVAGVEDILSGATV